MPRMKAAKRSELETFWRAHLDGWRRSDLNQREYCEAHGLPLKRFGNWRAKFKHEDDVPRQKLLWRRGGGLKHMSKHMLKENPSAPSSYVPSARSGGPGRRRNFMAADKRRIVEETCRGGASVSGVARKYGIGCPSHKLCQPQKSLKSRPLSIDASYAYAYARPLHEPSISRPDVIYERDTSPSQAGTFLRRHMAGFTPPLTLGEARASFR